MAGNIDMVITKSISRFARNTLDCLQYIRQLKDKNIPVYFEKEAINTLDAKGEVLITIMASLAQQESQSMSQNIKLGLQYRYQQGKVQVNHNRFLGYTKDDNGHLIIDPEQAEIVKRIYREYLEGSSMDKIADGLMADGILTGAGKTKWHTSTINKILRNEKYMGDALLQKTYTTDFLTKKRIKNNGTVPQYYRRGRPRSDHSERTLYAGAGRACPSPGSPRQPDRQETQLLLQSMFCTDGFLRRLRRALPTRSLEQPRLQVHRLALHQSLGAYLR